MKSEIERALVVLIYAVSGWLVGAGLFGSEGINRICCGLVGSVIGAAWSWRKEFPHVWRAGFAFAAAGLPLPIFVMTLMLISVGLGHRPEARPLAESLMFVLSGWIFGSSFGTGILSRRRIVAARQAALAGAGVGFLASIAFCMWTMEVSESDDGPSMLTGQIILTGFGILLGAAAGYLLYRVGKRQDATLACESAINSNKTLQLKINPVEEFEKYHDAGEDQGPAMN